MRGAGIPAPAPAPRPGEGEGPREGPPHAAPPDPRHIELWCAAAFMGRRGGIAHHVTLWFQTLIDYSGNSLNHPAGKMAIWPCKAAETKFSLRDRLKILLTHSALMRWARQDG